MNQKTEAHMGHWLARVHKKWQSWDSTPDLPDSVVSLLHPTFSPQLSHISAGTVSALLHANISHHGDACISWSSLSTTVRVPRPEFSHQKTHPGSWLWHCHQDKPLRLNIRTHVEKFLCRQKKHPPLGIRKSEFYAAFGPNLLWNSLPPSGPQLPVKCFITNA